MTVPANPPELMASMIAYELDLLFEIRITSLEAIV